MININKLNDPIKRRSSRLDLKNKIKYPAICTFQCKRHIHTTWEVGKKKVSMETPKTAEIAIVISDKIDFKISMIMKDK